MTQSSVGFSADGVGSVTTVWYPAGVAPIHPRPPSYTATVSDDDLRHPEPVAVASFATEGEAEVAVAKLRAFGIEAALDDQVEGGLVVVEGEPGVIVQVPAPDAADAQRLLTEESTVPEQPASDV